MATSSSKSSLSPHHLSHFTPIEEGNEDEECSQGHNSFRERTPSNSSNHHSSETRTSKKSSESEELAKNRGILCNKCRPSNREKITIVPLTSPNGIFKSICSSLVKKSPRLSTEDSSSTISRDENWKVTVSELSQKVIQATRKRDEAVYEVSRLKSSMSELEKKLNKLEIYCQDLKSNLQIYSKSENNENHEKSVHVQFDYKFIKVGDESKVIEHFLVAVSEARSSIRTLSRALTLQLRQIGGKVYNHIALLLQPYEIKISISRNPRGLLFYLEALLNKAFFEDFESIGFKKGSCSQILNPIDRCEANFAMFTRLTGLKWEEVLNKGTKHFSDDFSRFCDRKMSEIVAMLGWNQAWSEQLLQTFFDASKAVYLVHLLANSVHPGLQIFRVDKEVKFDSVYMEDMGGGEKTRKLVPIIVRIMVTPGFYVYDNVVKCKVLSRYYNNYVYSNGGNEIDLTPSPN